MKKDDLGAELGHIAEEMYKKNLDLVERNKTLSLLQKIDDIVLSGKSSIAVTREIANAIFKETNFSFVEIQFKKSRNSAVNVVKAGTGKQKVAAIFKRPLVVRGQKFGLLVIGSNKPEKNISQFQKNLIDRLVGVIGIALDNKLLYEEITAANKKLKELDKAKDEFISLASHQLRTPITTIRGYLSMFEEGLLGELTPDKKEFIERVLDASTNMNNLIGDLLNVSRIQAGRFLLTKTSTDLLSITERIVNQLDYRAKSKGLKLIFTKPKNKIPELMLDASKMEQVISNFVDNSIHYTKSGKVSVSLDKVGNEIIFKVTDTGIGIPKAEQSKLFQKLFRATNAKKTRPDGTGLGIYLAKRVVEEHGGKIIFDSVEGKGSTFGFTILIK